MDLPLAAYGTLRPGCGGLEHLGIEDAVEDLGSCTLYGRLWIVKEMVAETKKASLVPAYYPSEKGEVQGNLLRIPEEVWGKIDFFEDFTPHDPESAYTREEIKTKEGVSAWTYLANNIERINFLRDGDWKSYARHPKAIPLFHAKDLYITN